MSDVWSGRVHVVCGLEEVPIFLATSQAVHVDDAALGQKSHIARWRWRRRAGGALAHAGDIGPQIAATRRNCSAPVHGACAFVASLGATAHIKGTRGEHHGGVHFTRGCGRPGGQIGLALGLRCNVVNAIVGLKSRIAGRRRRRRGLQPPPKDSSDVRRADADTSSADPVSAGADSADPGDPGDPAAAAAKETTASKDAGDAQQVGPRRRRRWRGRWRWRAWWWGRRCWRGGRIGRWRWCGRRARRRWWLGRLEDAAALDVRRLGGVLCPPRLVVAPVVRRLQRGLTFARVEALARLGARLHGWLRRRRRRIRLRRRGWRRQRRARAAICAVGAVGAQVKRNATGPTVPALVVLEANKILINPHSASVIVGVWIGTSWGPIVMSGVVARVCAYGCRIGKWW